MKIENRLLLERMVGIIEGVACCINNQNISNQLYDVAEAIDNIIKKMKWRVIFMDNWELIFLFVLVIILIACISE